MIRRLFVSSSMRIFGRARWLKCYPVGEVMTRRESLSCGRKSLWNKHLTGMLNP